MNVYCTVTSSTDQRRIGTYVSVGVDRNSGAPPRNVCVQLGVYTLEDNVHIPQIRSDFCV